MKLTIRKQIEETIDVEFPVYVRYGDELAKVISPDEVVAVDEKGGLKLWTIGETFVQHGKPVEHSVFNNAFQTALTKFNQLALEEDDLPISDLTAAEEEEYLWHEHEEMSRREREHYEIIHNNLND